MPRGFWQKCHLPCGHSAWHWRHCRCCRRVSPLLLRAAGPPLPPASTRRTPPMCCLLSAPYPSVSLSLGWPPWRRRVTAARLRASPSPGTAPHESKAAARITASSSPSWCTESIRDRPNQRRRPRHRPRPAELRRPNASPPVSPSPHHHSRQLLGELLAPPSFPRSPSHPPSAGHRAAGIIVAGNSPRGPFRFLFLFLFLAH